MDFTTGQYLQLIIALFSGVVLFAIAYVAPVRLIVTFIVITIPFQPIMSIYGSINMVLIYLAAGALFVRGKMRLFPLLGAVLAICFAYALSLSQTLRPTYFDHLLYLVSVGSDFLVFYLVYNYFREEGDLTYAIKLFVWVAAIVNAYFLLSMLTGFHHFAILGIQELSLGQNIESLKRLVGPFNAPGTNAEFLAIQILLLSYIFLYETRKSRRAILFVLMAAALAFLVATGSRGGFVALLGGAMLFAVLFRKKLGVMGIVRAGIATLVLGIVAITVIQFTQFNVLFERLGDTQFHGVVPDTRVGVFEQTWERIKEEPLLGHGPRIQLLNEDERTIPGYRPLGGYPHSLYLFLLYTVGVVGLAAYLVFFLALARRWASAISVPSDDALLRGLPRLALVLVAVFLASQFRIEFLRFLLNDYQNYLFALWGTLLAFTDRLGCGGARETKRQASGVMEKPRILVPKRNTEVAIPQKSIQADN